MKIIYGLLMALIVVTMPVFAQDGQSANDIVLKMQHDLNLSEDQVSNITQIVERYVDASNELQKSIEDGTSNQSSIDSQKQQLKAEEDQGIAQYLRSDQLNTWRLIQSQEQPKDTDSATGDNPGPDQYSNLPGH